MAGAHRLHVLAGHEVAAGVLRQQPDHGIHHRDVDELTLTRALALDDRGQHAHRREEPGAEVGHGQPHAQRPAARLAGDAHGAAHRLDGDVEGTPARVGACLPVGRDRAVHDVRPHGAHRLVVEAQALDHAGPEVFHADVARASQVEHHLAAVRLLHIDHDSPLVAVDGQEVVAFAADHLSLGVARLLLERGLLPSDPT